MPRTKAKKLILGSYNASYKTRAVVSSVNPKIGPKLNIFGQLFDQDILFQIDTGAQVSCLPRKFVPSSFMKTLTPAPFQLESYNGTTIKVFGCLQADLQIGSIQLENCIFQIVEDFCSPILGTPEIFENGIVIDIQNATITKKNKSEQMTVSNIQASQFAGLKVVKKSTFFETIASSANSYRIPPKTSTTINVKLSEYPTSTVYAVPEQISRNKNLEIYDQVIQILPGNLLTRINITNKSDSSILIDEGMLAVKLNEVQVKTPESPESGKFRQIMNELMIGELPLNIKQKVVCGNRGF